MNVFVPPGKDCDTEHHVRIQGVMFFCGLYECTAPSLMLQAHRGIHYPLVNSAKTNYQMVSKL